MSDWLDGFFENKAVVNNAGIAPANSSVTNAKLANMPLGTVKCRASLTDGVPGDLLLTPETVLLSDATGLLRPGILGTRIGITGDTINVDAVTRTEVMAVDNFALIDADGDITNEAGTKISGVPSYTWATRPTASTNTGKWIWISDVGIAGCMMRSNGTRWMPTEAVTLQRVVNGTPENRTTAGSYTGTLTIPADLLATGDRLTFGDVFKRNGVDAVAPVYRIYMGTSGTPGSNSMIYTKGIANTDGQAVCGGSELFFTSTTAALTTRDLIKGGVGTTGVPVVVNTLLNTAAAMSIYHQLESINSGSVDLYVAEVTWKVS